MDFREILRSELTRVERQIREAQARSIVLRRTLDQYDGLGASSARGSAPRMGKAGRAASAKAKSATRTPPQAGKIAGKVAGAPTKADRIRAIVAAHAAKGVTARDVMSKLGAKGAKGGINAIHSALSKLKQAKLVTATGGKYFPTAALTKGRSS
jgi:hypothetical protein